jgi:subtilisin family serine protease
MKKMITLLLTITLSLTLLPAPSATVKAQTGEEKFRRSERPVPGQYIVVLKGTEFPTIETDTEPVKTGVVAEESAPAATAGATDTDPRLEPTPEPTPEDGRPEESAPPDPEVIRTADELTKTYGGTYTDTFGEALKGFVLQASEESAVGISRDARVLWVEEDGEVTANTTQWNPPSWGLDRIDQHFLPLSSSYTYTRTGAGVNGYVIDTGILFSHTDFTTPFPRAYIGTSTVGGNGIDCNGHGTHVAGTMAGTKYGVAKGLRFWGVQVLNCAGSGTVASVIAGVNWVRWHRLQPPFINSPAVANMSLGGSYSAALNAAVVNAINAKITFAVAAGNNNGNACLSSPASVGPAITVGATDKWDFRSWFSNWGPCLDLFAPGEQISSAWIGWPTNNATATISGTSMASPHAAGVAAQYLQMVPWATPAQVSAALNANATAGVVINPGPGSPNRLLFTNY